MAAVQDILAQIESLSDEERLALDRRLAAKLRADWLRESGAARIEARRRGITQAVIDRAIEQRRYGR